MKILLVSNSQELNNSICRYLAFASCQSSVATFRFDDLRIISKEILEMDFIVSEVYKVSLDSIEDYGLDMLLSFMRMRKGGILFHVDRIEDPSLSKRAFLFKVPDMTRELLRKIKSFTLEEKVTISPEDASRLKAYFPYRVAKDHHRGSNETFNR